MHRTSEHRLLEKQKFDLKKHSPEKCGSAFEYLNYPIKNKIFFKYKNNLYIYCLENELNNYLYEKIKICFIFFIFQKKQC